MRKLFAVTMALLLVLAGVPAGAQPAVPVAPALREAQGTRFQVPGAPVAAAPPRTRIGRIQADFFDGQTNDPPNPAHPLFSTAGGSGDAG